MKCPYCESQDNRVIDSRDLGDVIRRRRLCLECKARFTSYEKLQAGKLFIVKKDGRREDFSRDKLFSGIKKACEKRPLPTGTIDKLVEDIETQIYHLGKPEVQTYAVGDIVMEKLKTLDHIAYIRFASVYREFADIGILKEAVDNVVESGNDTRPTNQLPLLSDEELKELTNRKIHRKGKKA